MLLQACGDAELLSNSCDKAMELKLFNSYQVNFVFFSDTSITLGLFKVYVENNIKFGRDITQGLRILTSRVTKKSCSPNT